MFEKITAVINPTISKCVNKSRKTAGNDSLSIENFEKLLQILMPETKKVFIEWRGAEPLIWGLDNFKKAMELEQKIRKKSGKNISFVNTIETAGELIDSSWSRFFKKHDFDVRVRFDNTEHITEKIQKNKEKSLSSLKKAGVKAGALSIISSKSFDQTEFYEYCREKQLDCAFVMTSSEEDKSLIDKNDCISTVKKLFDRWAYDKNGINVKMFKHYVSMILDIQTDLMCQNSCCPGDQIFIDPKGDIYPCGLFKSEEFLLGNIADCNRINDIFSSQGILKLLSSKNTKCMFCKDSGCRFFKYCKGGCVYSLLSRSQMSCQSDFDCDTFRGIFSHAEQFINNILINKTDLSTLNPHLRNCFIDYISSRKI